jgi:hypothetical protein
MRCGPISPASPVARITASADSSRKTKTPVGSAARPSSPPASASASISDRSRLVKLTRRWPVAAPSAVKDRRSSSTMIRSPARSAMSLRGSS